MMLDAQTDYDNAISADDAAYQVIAGPALQQFGNTIESDEAARDADLQAGQDDLQKTVDSQEATVTSAENAADSTEQSAEDSADQAAQTLEQQANDQAAQLVAGFQAAEAASDAKAEADYNSTVSADQSQEDTTAATVQANYDSQSAIYQSQHDATIDADATTYQTALTSDMDTYDSQVASLDDTYNTAIQNAENSAESQPGSLDSTDWTTVLNNDAGLNSAMESIYSGYDSDIASLESNLQSVEATADARFASDSQDAMDGYNTAMQKANDTYDAAVSKADGDAASRSATAQQTEATEIGGHAADFQTKADAADAAYNVAVQSAASDQATADQNADDAYNTSAQPVLDAFNSWLTGRQTQLANDLAARKAQLTSDEDASQATYDNTMAPVAAQENTDVQSATDGYNNTVAGLSQTESSEDQGYWDAYNSTMQGASQTLQAAEDAYNDVVNQIYDDAMNNGTDPDQGALDAAYATLQTAYHAYSNTSAGAAVTLTIGLGADYKDFISHEEDAYVTEQDAIAKAKATYDVAEVTAEKSLADADADAEASDVGDEAQINATYNDDVATHTEGVDLTLAAFEQTRQQGYADAQAIYNDAVESAWETQVNAYAKAAKTRDDADAISVQEMDDALADIDEQRGVVVDDAADRLVQDEVSANAGYVQQMLVAIIGQVDAYKNIEASTDKAEVADAVSVESQVQAEYGSALTADTNSDPAAMSEWSAWSQYLSQAAAAWQQLVDGEIGDMTQEVGSDESAYEQEVNHNETADEALASQLESLALNGDLAVVLAIDTQNHQDDAAIPGLVATATAAHTLEVRQEASVDVTAENADTAAAKQQAYKYFSASLTWMQSVLPVMLAANNAEQDKAASVIAYVAKDGALLEHDESEAVVTLVDTLIPAAQAAVHSDAVAHKTYMLAMADGQIANATQAAKDQKSTVAAEPDSDFDGPQDASTMNDFTASSPQVPDRMADAEQRMSIKDAIGFTFWVYTTVEGRIWVMNTFGGTQIPYLKPKDTNAAGQEKVADAPKPAQPEPAEVAKPVYDLKMVEGKLVTTNANATPFLLRFLINKFNQETGISPEQAAGFMLFIETLRLNGVTTASEMWQFARTIPDKNVKDWLIPWLTKVAP